MKPFLAMSIALGALSLAISGRLLAQGTGITVEGGVGFINPGSPTVPEAEANSRPVPRLPDGTIDLTGPWVGGGAIADIERDGGLKPGELPLLPWTIAMAYTSKGLSHMYILHELADAGAHRVVYMDGRPHPTDLIPTWLGHSIGRWQGDTLVVDTVGYNDKFWFDRRGTPHSEQLHTIERYTRPNYGTLVNEVTLDDPGALAHPVNLKFTSRLLRPNRVTGTGDLLEFICNEDNQYGSAGGFRPGTGVSRP